MSFYAYQLYWFIIQPLQSSYFLPHHTLLHHSHKCLSFCRGLSCLAIFTASCKNLSQSSHKKSSLVAIVSLSPLALSIHFRLQLHGRGASFHSTVCFISSWEWFVDSHLSAQGKANTSQYQNQNHLNFFSVTLQSGSSCACIVKNVVSLSGRGEEWLSERVPKSSFSAQCQRGSKWVRTSLPSSCFRHLHWIDKLPHHAEFFHFCVITRAQIMHNISTMNKLFTFYFSMFGYMSKRIITTVFIILRLVFF